MDDYYELLGVDDDAGVDDIRSAYRDKRAAASGKDSDNAKAEAAALNKAWNVLSDPYQRGRYDQQRATENGGESDDSDSGSDDGDDAPARPARTVREAYKNDKNDKNAKKRNPRPLPKQTVTLPPGTMFPTTRQRLMAMMADLGVLFAVFLIASLIITPAVAKSLHKPIVDRVNTLKKELDADTTKSNALSKAASTAKSNSSAIAKKSGATSADAKNAAAAATAAANASTHYSDHTLKNATTAFNDESKKLQPISVAVGAVALLLCLFYLAIPSAQGGQTVGKRLQGIRVIRTDGTPVGFVWALRRYGLILFVTFALVFVTPFGALGAALVLFSVTTWTRNPNRQGHHDRLVKTLVVTDANHN